MKPLFIPLKTEFFEEFKSGEKDTEYRRYGPRWNEQTCYIGRPVILAKGYTRQRLTGVITDFHINDKPQYLDGWSACYGKVPDDIAACITIKLD